ncbi:MAG: DUF6603 domain-containing protein [Gemmatimonadaceae bacterium]
MPNQPGTLDVIALELAKVVKPLEEQIESGDILEIFAELGIRFPEELANDPHFQSALTDALHRLEQLPDLIATLLTQIDAEDDLGAAQTAFELTEAIVQLIRDIDSIAQAIDATSGSFPEIDVTDFVANLSRNLLDFLLVNYLESVMPAAAAVLELIGVVERSQQNVGSVNPVNPPYIRKALHFSQFTHFFSDPSEHLRTLYGWGNNDFDGALLLEKLNKVLLELGFPVLLDTTAVPHRLNLLLFELSAKTDLVPPGLQLLLKYLFTVDGTYNVVREGWHADFGIEAQVPLDAGVVLTPAWDVAIVPPGPGTIEGKTFARWIANPPTGQTKLVLLSMEGVGRLEIAGLRVELRLDLAWDGTQATSELIIEGEISGGSIIIDTTKGDGFLAKILPGTRIQADFGILLGMSSERGFYFQGSSALEIRLPVHIDIGPISLEGLTLTLKVGQNASTGFTELPISLGADIKAALGPLTAVVQNMGLTARFSFPTDNSGNLGGGTQLDFEFKPPNGVGLSIDAGGIKGGGFLYLDFDKGEYIGALELEFQGLFSLKAIGLINTKLPDGSPGFALLIIIVAEFTPIQLGFGFSLNGVGGLLGLNRTVRIDVLRQGVKTGALNSVLFPQDVVANITRIVSDLKQIFPIAEGHFLIGPMAKIGWGGSILTLELGLLLDIPRPMFAILGVLRLSLPTEDAPVLKIQVNFLGVVDFENKYISFDASLFDSKLLVFTLTGDMALRINWGATSVFVLSVGGFHPAFHEVPADLQSMTRITIALLSGNNPRITIQCYFAVTSNTLQFGARAELYAAACGFNIYGYIGFDVLFQFDPFRFIAEISAGIALRRGTRTIMSLKLRGSLAGPQPWDVHGKASFSILFFDVTVSFHETWGDDPDSLPKEKADVKALLLAQLADDRNWRAIVPDNNHLHVTVKKIEAANGAIVIHPFGALAFSESVVPLNYTIDKFGEKLPLDDTRFAITNVHSGTMQLPTSPAKDRFAPAQFTTMSDSEKLSAPSFESMDSGFSLSDTANVTMPTPVNKNVEYEVSYLNEQRTTFGGLYLIDQAWFNMGRLASAVANSTISFKHGKLPDLAPAEVINETELFTVASVSDMRPFASAFTAGSYAEALQQQQALVAVRPALKGKVQVVSTFELSDP